MTTIASEAGPLTSGEVTRRRVEAITYAPMTDALRNHLVTLAYVDLSDAMAELLGAEDANWCCLATWPSFTVGETIRTGRSGRIRNLMARLPLPAAMQDRLATSLIGGKADTPGVMNRSLAAGNRGVFYEIGLAWTDFLDTFGSGERTEADWDEFEQFGKRVLALPFPPGRVWPDGAREQLRDGFRAYLEALHTSDPARRSQLILLGNMRIGDHEQRRLQGWLDLSTLDPIRKMTRQFDDDTTRNRGIAFFERWWTGVLTKRLYSVKMADETIRVGHEVPPHATSDGALFPAPLDVLDDDVALVFDEIDGAARGGDGAERWNDIDHRMAFIVTLFRSRQRAQLVGINPYTPGEVTEILDAARVVDETDARYELEGPLLFADMTTELESPWTPEVERAFMSTLEMARRRADDPADKAIDDFYQHSNRPVNERFYSEALHAMSAGDNPAATPLVNFLNEPPVLPEWADMDLIRQGQAFYSDYRTAAHIGLFFGSMPLSYAASKGCQVLGLVSTLSGDTVRRFWESAKFIEDVFTTPFWEAGSDGHKSIRGVRLFHAAIRDTIESDSVHIVYRPADLEGHIWDTDWGRPINQEDYLGATIDWSVAAIHVMDRFGVALSEEDALAYFHTWMVIGALLGVDDELLRSPADPTKVMSLPEAQYTARLILFRQLGPTTAGRRLMEGLLGLIDDWFPRSLRSIPRAMMYLSMNEEIAGILGLPPAGRTERNMMRMNEVGRSWRTNALYARGFRHTVNFVGNRWLEWWENEYKDVPPYRRGGQAAVVTRTPASLQLTIESYGLIGEELQQTLTSIDGVDATVDTDADDDEGYEGLVTTSIVNATAQAGASMRAAVRSIRDSLTDAANIRRAELLIDGVPVAISSLSDAEIDALFPA